MHQPEDRRAGAPPERSEAGAPDAPAGGPDDRHLWSRAAAGDGAAYGELFRRHHRPVYNFLFRRSGDWNRAEDLTSVTFLEAWRRRGEVEVTTDEVLPWLLGIAHNVVRNEWRQRRRHRAALERLHALQGGCDTEEGPDVASRIDDQQRMRRVLELVERLPERERVVLELVVWAGLPYEQAAAALGVPVGTVRSRLSRGRARLAHLEAEFYRDPGVDPSRLAPGYPSTQETI